jgi:hypothetical protein
VVGEEHERVEGGEDLGQIASARKLRPPVWTGAVVLDAAHPIRPCTGTTTPLRLPFPVEIEGCEYGARTCAKDADRSRPRRLSCSKQRRTAARYPAVT